MVSVNINFGAHQRTCIFWRFKNTKIHVNIFTDESHGPKCMEEIKK